MDANQENQERMEVKTDSNQENQVRMKTNQQDLLTNLEARI
jgi:hypothetical protein